MKHVLKRYYKPILVLALLGLIGAALCRCKMLPVEGCQHDLMLRQKNAIVLNVQETEVEYTYELSQVPCGQLGYSYDMYECRICGSTIYRRASDKPVRMQHDMSSWKTVKEATCTQAGEEMRYCTRGCCNVDIDNLANNKGYVTRAVLALGHNYKKIDAVPATCTEAGLTDGSICGDCGTVLTAQKEIPALGHTPAEAVVENEVAASCVEGGTYESVVCCSACGEEISRETVETDALGHTGGTATCKAQAVCERCGEPYGELGAHQFVEVEPEKPASCDEEGITALYRCVVCEEAERGGEEIPSLGHNFVDGKCTRCDEPETAGLPED